MQVRILKFIAPLTAWSLAVFSSPSALAQTPLHVQFGDQPADEFGTSAANLGDVDNDGVADYAFGTRISATPGYVRVFSGATGQTITTLTGNSAGDWFGISISGIGDINGDQVPDLLVGASEDDTYGVDEGMARVYSGKDWSILREHPGSLFNFGFTTGSLGDVNGDGTSDYLVSDQNNFVYCFSGASGAVLWQVQSSVFDHAHVLPPTVGDASGDGVFDVLLGAPGQLGTGFGGYAVVLDGTDGSEILRVTGNPTERFASAVSWIGDLNGDLREEFAVAAPYYSPGGYVDVYDGISGALVYRTFGTSLLGTTLCGVGDYDADGIEDFVAHDQFVARLFSGATGNQILSYDDFSITGSPLWLAPAGDLDADGSPDLLHGSRSTDGRGSGVVFLSSAHLFSDQGFSLGGQQGDPVLAGEGTMQAGSVALIRLSNVPAFIPAFLVLGLSAVNLPLAGGTLVPSPDGILGGLTTGPSGDLDLWSVIPPGIPSQTEYYMQYWVLDPTGPEGVTASNALKAVFQ